MYEWLDILMGRIKKEEVKRELILAILVMVIFVSLVVTWTILGAIDEYSTNLATGQSQKEVISVPGSGNIGVKILPIIGEEIEGDDS
jgi:hypothetical protein